VTLQQLIETVPLSFWTRQSEIEVHIFEDGKCFEIEHVITEKVDGRMVIEVQKGERC
jgi:hypothetical protein